MDVNMMRETIGAIAPDCLRDSLDESWNALVRKMCTSKAAIEILTENDYPYCISVRNDNLMGIDFLKEIECMNEFAKYEKYIQEEKIKDIIVTVISYSKVPIRAIDGMLIGKYVLLKKETCWEIRNPKTFALLHTADSKTKAKHKILEWELESN